MSRNTSKNNDCNKINDAKSLCIFEECFISQFSVSSFFFFMLITKAREFAWKQIRGCTYLLRIGSLIDGIIRVFFLHFLILSQSTHFFFKMCLCWTVFRWKVSYCFMKRRFAAVNPFVGVFNANHFIIERKNEQLLGYSFIKFKVHSLSLYILRVDERPLINLIIMNAKCKHFTTKQEKNKQI